MKEFERARSLSGQVIVCVERLMEEFARREDGTVSNLLQDIRFDNHNKMTTDGIVVVGTEHGGTELLADADFIMPRSSYKPTGIIFTGVFSPDIRPGDRAFYHYLCGENKAMVQPVKEGFYISMNSSDIFCVERKGKILWNHNYCAGTEIVVDERRSVILNKDGSEIKAKVNPSTGIELIVGLLAPPMVDECIMWGIQKSQYGDVSEEVKDGDHVYLSRDCQFSNYITDKKVWIFRHSDVLALVKKNLNDTVPVGPYHLVKVAVEDWKQETRRKRVHDDLTGYDATLLSKHPILISPNTGNVVASGKHCKYAKPGQEVLFSKRWTKMLDRTRWLVHDGEIQGIL